QWSAVEARYARGVVGGRAVQRAVLRLAGVPEGRRGRGTRGGREHAEQRDAQGSGQTDAHRGKGLPPRRCPRRSVCHTSRERCREACVFSDVGHVTLEEDNVMDRNRRQGRTLTGRASMAISVLALFVALGGTAAAVTQLPRDSVGSPQIRTDAVRSPEIAKDAVRSPEIAKDAGRAPEIARR